MRSRTRSDACVRAIAYWLRGVAVLGLLLLPNCGFVEPTAPTDASFSISANPLFVDLDGTSTITVIVTDANGTPVPDGTIVSFTTTLGKIAPNAGTRGGQVRESLAAGNQPGVATVTARSGVADTSVSVDVTIGSEVDSIQLSANPATLPIGGGESTITAVVFGKNFETLANVPVTFSTDAGTLASEGGVVRTDAKGEARDTLTTPQSATVTVTTGTISDTTEVEVGANTPPTANLTASPVAPKVGETVNFSAAASNDPDGTIVSYDWDFGDGATDEGERVSHVYQDRNIYVVVLVVTDNDGASSSANQNIVVTLGDSPIASFTFSPSAPMADVAVTFDASASRDPDGRIVEYQWDWGDGTSPVVRGEGEPTATHTFAVAATYAVTLTVTDDLGNTATSVQSVTVS